MKNIRKFKIPILLVGFNRPDLIKQVLDRVAMISPARLYIAIDGPRNKQDEEKIAAVKRIVEVINWRCEVKTIFQKSNLGCKYGPVAAMNWFFENEEMGIILEDDVLADKSFFYFVQELLIKYKDEKRVGSISGNNFQFGKKRGNGDYYFSRYSHSCGWATWRRAWDLYDIDMVDYLKKKDVVLSSIFNRWLDKLYWKLIFGGIVSGELDSAWDYQWNWMMWKHGMLGIIPNVNLVKNIGFGRMDATHTKYRSKFEDMEVNEMDFPMRHPINISQNFEADDFSQHQNYVLWKEMVMKLIRRWNLVYRKVCSFVY